MHIGFDISQTGAGKAGCGFYAHSIVQSLLAAAPQNHYSLFPSFGDFYFDPLMPLGNPYHGASVSYGPRHLSRECARDFWYSESVETRLDMPDIIHANNFWCPLKFRSARLIYTFYDMGFLSEPAWTTTANHNGCFEGVFRSSLAADWVVAISKASREHYLEVFPHFPEDRIRVIYPCSRFSDASELGTKPKMIANMAADSFWLTVGTIEPRKNQLRLAEAYARYVEMGGKRMPLVFAGGNGWLMDDFESHLDELGIRGDVVITGYVTDDELIWLYRNCYANLYPSLFEGFGLPLLEGMQFSAATLTSNTSSLPEVAGQATILLSPTDTEGWAQAMLSIAENYTMREDLRQSGLEQAARFNWQVSMDQLLRLYEEALAVPKLATSF